MRTKRALFRGTTSFRRTLPTRRTSHPDQSCSHCSTGFYQGLAITGSPVPLYSPSIKGISAAVNPSDVQRQDAVGASSLRPTFSISVSNVYSSRRRFSLFSCLKILYLVRGRMSTGIQGIGCSTFFADEPGRVGRVILSAAKNLWQRGTDSSLRSE